MRQLISVDEMTKLINSTLDVRDKAIITMLAKTGIRRKELITLHVDDIDWWIRVCDSSPRQKGPTEQYSSTMKLL
jgi:integrase